MRIEPTAPYHSAQDALRVLETVAGHATGVTDTELARTTGLGPEISTLAAAEAKARQEQTGCVWGGAVPAARSCGERAFICRCSSQGPWRG